MRLIAGVDEVGRGPLAGPVVAAAVILNEPIKGLKDSKLLSQKRREFLAEIIQTQALCYAIAECSSDEIDELNIHGATMLAMQRAVNQLRYVPERVLIDGLHAPKLTMFCETFIQGDQRIASISAASIIAKVHRDNIMITMDAIYPEYGFSKHKGYPTLAHRRALMTYGACPIHRQSFAPVKACKNREPVL